VEIKEKSFDLPMQEVLCRWLEWVKPRIKQSTYARYIYVVQRHILPVLGDIPAGRIDRAAMDRFVAEKLRSGRIDQGGGLSPKSVRDITNILCAALRYAVQEGMAESVPSGFFRPPASGKEMRVLSRREQAQLEHELRRGITPQKLGILICLYTGIRIGEACALSWKDIDLETGTLTVRHTLQRIVEFDEELGTRTRILLDTPKSRTSLRTIPLPDFFLELLRKYAPQDPECYVITGKKTFQEPRTFQNHFYRCLKAAGLPRVNFHTLRHTFATRCVEVGFDVKSLSEILGHATVGMTLNQYVHSSMEQKRRQMEQLNLLGNF
jgi:integrase